MDGHGIHYVWNDHALNLLSAIKWLLNRQRSPANCGTTVAVAGAFAITAAQIRDFSHYSGTAGGAVAFTFPGAELVLAALTHAASIGDTWDLYLRITDANPMTITAGAGDTLISQGGNEVVQAETVHLQYKFTNVTTGTAAAEIWVLDM